MLYDDVVCNFNNILEAYKKAHKGKTNAQEVIEFDKNKIYNLNLLLQQLKNKEWDKIFQYYRFTITKPKERIVDAMLFPGRIVQHILCDKILKPWFEKRLIFNNAACRENKGTDFAIKRVKNNLVNFLKEYNEGFVLKLDIKKYFPSIDREILKTLLSKFPDKSIVELLIFIVDNCPDENGIPIGNQTSQWFALFYLDYLDRKFKEYYHIKYYVRYMDDIIILHPNKNYLKEILEDIKFLLSLKRRLVFNTKTQITPLHKGFSFLGWKFLYKENNKIIMRICNEKVEFRKSKIKEIYKKYKTNKITDKDFKDRIRSMKVLLDKGNTNRFKWKYLYYKNC